MNDFIWNSLLRATLEGSIALASVYVICRVFQRLPAWGKCWLWRLAWLRLLIAFVSPISLELHVTHRPADPLPLAEVGPGERPELIFNTATEIVSPATPSTQTTPQINWTVVCTTLWIAGATLFLLRLALQYRSLKRLQHSPAVPATSELQSFLAAASEKLGVRAPALAISDSISIPLLTGIFRPTILLPGTITKLDAAQIELIFKHELAHLKRRDLLWNWLPAAAQILFWFNPLVWLCSRESALAQEIACDERALAGDVSKSAPLAQLLLDLVAIKNTTPPPQVFAASVVHTKALLERRLKAIMLVRTNSKRAVALLLFTLVAAAPVLLPWHVTAQISEAPITKTSAEKPKSKESPTPVPESGSDAALEEILRAELAIAEKQLAACQANFDNGTVSSEELIAQKRDVLKLKRRIAATRGDYAAAAEHLKAEIALVTELQQKAAARVKIGVVGHDEQRRIDRELLQLKAEEIIFQKDSTIRRSLNRNRVDLPGGELSKPMAMLGNTVTTENIRKEEDKLATLLSRFSDTHPQVIAQRQKIDLLKKQTAAQGLERRVLVPKNGIIELIRVKQGEKVKRGQVLATYDEHPGELKLRTAQAEYKIAQAEFELKKLETDKAITEAKSKSDGAEVKYLLEKSRLDLQRAEGQFDVARAKLDQTRFETDTDRIRSPVDGVVRLVNAVDGVVAKQNELIFVITEE
jgi:beta-lactamase regulating signal transducer with metallopeptidase domain